MRPQWFPRLPLLALALLVLLAALWSGLIRIGWELAPIQPMLPISHGALMVSGFLGILISLERAVALVTPEQRTGLRRYWYYGAPLLTALGALALVVGVRGIAGPLLITLGSLAMVAMSVVIVRRQPALFTLMMALGALSWLVGNALWLGGRAVSEFVLWWVGFPLLTIAGERLELARLTQVGQAGRAVFLGVNGLFLCGAGLALLNLDAGTRLAGVAQIGLALWLLRYDIARRTVRRPGLTRFIAICLLFGYFWLALGGLMGVVWGGVVAGPHYDALLHALFVGFVFSMIFGHAPIIIPSVLGTPVTFRAFSYVYLALLHVSLLVRIAGDAAGWFDVRRWGGMLNGIALLLFLVSTAYSVWVARKAASPAAGGTASRQGVGTQ